MLSLKSHLVFVYCSMDSYQRDKLIVLLREVRGDSSQREFARNLGFSYAALRSWESGESIPSLQNLDRIAQCKGWTIIQLFEYLGFEITPSVLFSFAMNLPKQARIELAQQLLNS